MKFWQDHWCGETSLTISYPELFRVFRDNEVSVAKLMKFDNGFLFGDVSFFACSGIRGTGRFHGYHIWCFGERAW